MSLQAAGVLTSPWVLYKRDGSKSTIPPDPFVFWANLCQHMFLSDQEDAAVLWCMEGADVCFGATLLDSDVWDSPCVSGQWKVALVKEGNQVKCRLGLLKQACQSQFPLKNQMPSWIKTFWE